MWIEDPRATPIDTPLRVAKVSEASGLAPGEFISAVSGGAGAITDPVGSAASVVGTAVSCGNEGDQCGVSKMVDLSVRIYGFLAVFCLILFPWYSYVLHTTYGEVIADTHRNYSR